MTPRPPRRLPPQGADPTGSASGSASCARPAPRWQSTRSPRSSELGRTGTGPARVGRAHGEECGARPSSSARPAMTGSTRTPSRTRHKSLESPVHRKVHAEFGGRLHGKGPSSCSMNTGPRRAAHPTRTPSSGSHPARPLVIGREDGDRASGPACTVLRWCGRRVGGLGPGLTSESADALSGCPSIDSSAGSQVSGTHRRAGLICPSCARGRGHRSDGQRVRATPSTTGKGMA